MSNSGPGLNASSKACRHALPADPDRQCRAQKMFVFQTHTSNRKIKWPDGVPTPPALRICRGLGSLAGSSATSRRLLHWLSRSGVAGPKAIERAKCAVARSPRIEPRVTARWSSGRTEARCRSGSPKHPAGVVAIHRSRRKAATGNDRHFRPYFRTLFSLAAQPQEGDTSREQFKRSTSCRDQARQGTFSGLRGSRSR